jgi:hypothetical protein
MARQIIDPFPMWETRDHDLWSIDSMETDHIKKCLMRIKTHPKLWRQRYIPLLEAELTKRGIKHG